MNGIYEFAQKVLKNGKIIDEIEGYALVEAFGKTYVIQYDSEINLETMKIIYKKTEAKTVAKMTQEEWVSMKSNL